MKKTIALILIGLGTGIASAQPVTIHGQTEPRVRVSYADLDIGTPEGADRLRSRVRAAAKGLCLDNNVDPLPFELMQRKCFRTALDDGYAKIDQAISYRLAGVPNLTSAIVIVGR